MDGRGHQAAAAQRDRYADVLAGGGLETVLAPEPVELRELSRGQRHRLELQHRRQQPFSDRPAGVLLGQPAQRGVQDDLVGQVVVRDLPLGAAHRRGDRGPHGRAALAGLLRRGLRRRGRRPRGSGRRWRLLVVGAGRGVLDVAQGDGTLRPGPGEPLQVNAEGGCGPAGDRRHPQPVADGGGGCGPFRRRGRFDGGGCGGRLGAGARRTRCLPGFEQRGQGGADGDGLPDRHQQLLHDPVVPALDFHCGLGGFDHSDDLAAGDGVAGFDPPLVEGSLVHVRAQGGHHEVDHRGLSPNRPRTAATIPSTWGRAACSRCLA